MDETTFSLADKVYFCETEGVKMGYIEKIHYSERNIFNILVDDEDEEKGYKRWKVEEFFITKKPEEAKSKWENYKIRLYQFKHILNIKRKEYRFMKGLSVLVEPFNKRSYKGMVLLIGKASLILLTENNKLMKVDKCICKPINEPINFRKDISNE